MASQLLLRVIGDDCLEGFKILVEVGVPINAEVAKTDH